MKLFLYIICIFSYFTSLCQKPNDKKTPQNWHLLDLEKDGYHGISLEKLYSKIIKKQKPKQIITVAVIDCGVDITHPELSNYIWKNKLEIPNNGIDDDKNGFIDDVNGWNFIGKIQGSTIEAIREYVRLRKEYESESDSTILKQKKEFLAWQRILEVKKEFFEYPQTLNKRILDYENIISFYRTTLKKTDSLTLDFLLNNPIPITEGLELKENYAQRIKALALYQNDKGMTLQRLLSMRKGLYIETLKTIEWAKKIIDNNDLNYFYKEVKYENLETNYTKNYGNSNILPLENHGTSCAGVIGASRNNSVGMKGITNNILIMPIRIFHKVSTDEVDKDVANAIYYAVNNGAKIINMSFGKYYSPQKKFVDNALLYAEKKGVLLISGAGNNSSDNDSLTFYPSSIISKKKIISNLITVGASTCNNKLICDFSNFGKKTVDVFAPGEEIYTTGLEHSYLVERGTSFAAPIVSGIGALLWSFYPQFTYKQIKYCIEESAIPINEMVINPENNQQVSFHSLSKKGGIVNAYKAFIIAQKIAKQMGQ